MCARGTKWTYLLMITMWNLMLRYEKNFIYRAFLPLLFTRKGEIYQRNRFYLTFNAQGISSFFFIRWFISFRLYSIFKVNKYSLFYSFYWKCSNYKKDSLCFFPHFILVHHTKRTVTVTYVKRSMKSFENVSSLIGFIQTIKTYLVLIHS